MNNDLIDRLQRLSRDPQAVIGFNLRSDSAEWLRTLADDTINALTPGRERYKGNEEMLDVRVDLANSVL